MQSLKNILFGKEYGLDKQVSFVGLFNAGKTTLVKRLKGEDEVLEDKYNPTMGMNLETIKINGLEVIVADLGGQKSFQESFWKPFVSKSAAVVFVFDSADASRVDEAGVALQKVLEWIPKHCIFLFLANKMDLENALKLEDIINRLNLKDLGKKPHSFSVHQISVLKNINLEEPINWLSKQISDQNQPEVEK